MMRKKASCSEITPAGARPEPSGVDGGRRGISRWGSITAVTGALILGLLVGSGIGDDGVAPPVLALDPSSMIGEDDGDAYTFVPFRRNLWAINHKSSSLRFFLFPSLEGKPIQPSRTYNINRAEFPADQVRYLVSDHNLTNYLWILNPSTGRVMYVKALRDGNVEASKILDVTRE